MRVLMPAAVVLFLFAAPVRADSPEYATDAEWWHARRQDATGGPGDGAVRPSLFTGAAGTSIAIEVPRGTGGVSPSLSLRYSSRSGRGNAGTGWSIELPRIVKSMKYGVDRAQSSAFKVFEFMGEELVQDGPQENGCDRYYSTTELYQKILFCPLTNQWRVYEKSGTELKFGSSPFSRYTNTTLGVTFECNLDEVTDTHGLSWKATWLDVGTNFRRLRQDLVHSQGRAARWRGSGGPLCLGRTARSRRTLSLRAACGARQAAPGDHGLAWSAAGPPLCPWLHDRRLRRKHAEGPARIRKRGH